MGENGILELKVFTLSTCSSCALAKNIASEVAEELNITYREISLSTQEGVREGIAYDIMSTPTVVLDDEVIVRGRLISKSKLKEEVKIRLDKWKKRALQETE